MRLRSLCFGILLLEDHTAASFVRESSGWADCGVRRSPSLKMSVPNALDIFTSGLASICRFPNGVTVENSAPQGSTLLQLFDVETSLECRVVRERISELDLVIQAVIPATSNSRVFSGSNYKYALPIDAEIPRLVVKDEKGGEITFVGRASICSYLDETFATTTSSASPPASEDIRAQVLNVALIVGNYVASFLRLGRGSSVASAASSASTPRPQKPLILYSYEGNQFCRLVREVMTELDIVYELRSAGKLSPRRQELADMTGGSSQCPFLVDPNTGAQMPESKDIIRYLYKTYAQWTPPNEMLQMTSDTILPFLKPLLHALVPLQAGSYNEDESGSISDISNERQAIEREAASAPVVIYTYSLSPFSSEAKALLDNLDIDYKEISLGSEWLPGFIAEGGAQKRAALLDMTGQSSLPHVFIGGKSVGGLFSGTPGLIPALQQGILTEMVVSACSTSDGSTFPPYDLEETGAFE